MNICLLGQFPPHIGGVSSHTYLLSRELVRRGDEVYVLTYPHPDIKDMEGVHVETAPTVNIKGLRGSIFLLTATLKLISLVRKYNIDVIHAHFLNPPGLIAVLAGGFTGKKVAVTVHGSDIFIHAQNPVLMQVIKYVLKKADYVAVVNETIREQILQLNVKGVDKKITVTPNAVDLDKFNPEVKPVLREELGLLPEQDIMLFVGNLVPQKGLEYLLDAKKRMKSQAELVIVGGGPLRSKLQEKVKSEGITGVHFTGPRRDVEKMMPDADIFVLPSVSEGSPITLLEAFATGLPSVTTEAGGIKELVTPDVGLTVPPEDPEALAAALDKLLEDEGSRRNMAKKAQVKAKKYGNLKIPY